MNYLLTCPAPQCGHTMTVSAENDDEAIKKLMEEGAKHQTTATHAVAQMTSEQAVAMIKEHMKMQMEN